MKQRADLSPGWPGSFVKRLSIVTGQLICARTIYLDIAKLTLIIALRVLAGLVGMAACSGPIINDHSPICGGYTNLTFIMR